jgi:3-phenylpropionate/cinnamic acid dioxygenase small subunit
MTDLNLHLKINDFYTRYAESICDGDIETWPEFFTEKCLYRIIPKTNYDRKLRIGPMFAESKGALKDRVVAIKETLVYSARSITHLVSGVRIVSMEGPLLKTRSMLAIYQTLVDGTTHIQLVGRTFDSINLDDGTPKFSERIVVFDSELLAGALVFPA